MEAVRKYESLLRLLIKILHWLNSQSPTHFEMTTRGTCGSRAGRESRGLVSSRDESGAHNAPSPIWLPMSVTAQTHPPPSLLTVTMTTPLFSSLGSRRTGWGNYQTTLCTDKTHTNTHHANISTVPIQLFCCLSGGIFPHNQYNKLKAIDV